MDCLLVAGADPVLCLMLRANLSGPNRQVMHEEPIRGDPSKWAKADMVILDVGPYRANHPNYRACLRECRRASRRLILLYDPPWPKNELATFEASRLFPKPLSVAAVAEAAKELMVPQQQAGQRHVES